MPNCGSESGLQEIFSQGTKPQPLHETKKMEAAPCAKPFNHLPPLSATSRARLIKPRAGFLSKPRLPTVETQGVLTTADYERDDPLVVDFGFGGETETPSSSPPYLELPDAPNIDSESDNEVVHQGVAEAEEEEVVASSGSGTLPRIKYRRASQAERLEIARLVIEENQSKCSVARKFKVSPATVNNITNLANAGVISAEANTIQGPLYGPLPPCPFLEGGCSLRGKRLSVAENYYLYCLVTMGGCTLRQVGAQFDLASSTVHNACDRARKGTFLSGRFKTSSVIDDESDRVLRGIAELEGAAKPSIAAMRELIIVEMRKSIARLNATEGSTTVPVRDLSCKLDTIQSCSIRWAGKERLVSRQCLWKYLNRYGYSKDDDMPSNL